MSIYMSIDNFKIFYTFFKGTNFSIVTKRQMFINYTKKKTSILFSLITHLLLLMAEIKWLNQEDKKSEVLRPPYSRMVGSNRGHLGRNTVILNSKILISDIFRVAFDLTEFSKLSKNFTELHHSNMSDFHTR